MYNVKVNPLFTPQEHIFFSFLTVLNNICNMLEKDFQQNSLATESTAAPVP